MEAQERHIPVTRLVMFMMGESELAQEDAEHLGRCKHCFTSMVEATAQHIQEPKLVRDQEKQDMARSGLKMLRGDVRHPGRKVA